MRQHLESGDGSKPSESIAKRFQIHAVDGGDDLLFERFVGGDVFLEQLRFGLVFSDEGCDLAIGGCVGHVRRSAGVFGRKNSVADNALYSAGVMVR
jgi:hypothetical protein